MDRNGRPLSTGTAAHFGPEYTTKPYEEGIILKDRSVITAQYIVREIDPNWKAGNLSPIESIIKLYDKNGVPWAVIAGYNFSFYPNTENTDTGSLGYFRYDFHPKVLGDGDLGGHPFFHLHREFDDDDDETNEEARFPTGLVSLAEVLSICEKILNPDDREQRLASDLANGEFDKLAMDLAPSGFNYLIGQYYTKKSWQNFSHKTKFERFVNRHRWHLPVLEAYKPAKPKKKKR